MNTPPTPPPAAVARDTVSVSGLSNREFLERYAQAGRIGLVGGDTLIDKAICRAERHLDPVRRWSSWSHAFLFEGRRLDGHHWIIESDLDIVRKHIRLGVQENRITKYFDEKLYCNFAVLDFGLPEALRQQLLREGLDLVANHARYSMRELVGTLIALRHPNLRRKTNVLSRDRSFYCSALVRHLFDRAGIDLAPGLDPKNTTPEDIARTPVPHATYLLMRKTLESNLRKAAERLRAKVVPRLSALKRLRTLKRTHESPPN